MLHEIFSQYKVFLEPILIFVETFSSEMEYKKNDQTNKIKLFVSWFNLIGNITALRPIRWFA